MSSRRLSLLLLAPALALFAAGCAADGSASDSDPSDWVPGDKADLGGDCRTPTAADDAWVHSVLVHATIEQGGPHHGAVDVLANPGKSAEVVGRFAYGPFLADLEDENISAWISVGDCQWASLGTARTDDTGSAHFSVAPSLLEGAGRHDVHMVVNGDGSDLYSSVWVVDADTKVAVFDIDGTLTTSDQELFKNILLGSEPEMYPGAPDVAWTLVDSGYLPIYVTGRPLYLDGRSRQWLRDRGFPRGPLKLVPNLLPDPLPLEAFVGEFKQRTFEALRDEQGLFIDYAYGNAATDICAYARAGVDTDHTFIIGDHGGEACQGFAPSQAVTSYPAHLPVLEALLGASGQ